MSNKNAIDRVRIGGSKVRTGCVTCKARRTKCDEATPTCQRCAKSGRYCEGYNSTTTKVPSSGHKFVHYIDPGQTASPGRRASKSSSPHSATVPSPPRVLSTSPEVDLESLRGLDFHAKVGAAHLMGPFDQSLFGGWLQRMQYHNKAIRHCIVALSAFQENFLFVSDPVSSEARRVLALSHYNKSVQAVVELNTTDPESRPFIMLITSVLYCALENIQGHFKSACRHLTSGIRLLAAQDQNELRRQTERFGMGTDISDNLRKVFIGLGTQAMGLEDPEANDAIMADLRACTSFPTDIEFICVEDALFELLSIINDTLRALNWVEFHDRDFDHPNAGLIEVGIRLDTRLTGWTKGYHLLLVKLSEDPRHLTLEQQLATLILRIYQVLARLLLRMRFSNSQVEFDSQCADFEELVNIAERFQETQDSLGENATEEPRRPIFTLAPGIVPALFYTCERCRHRGIRRRALRLLETCQRRESIWDSSLLSVVARRIMEMEEQAAFAEWCQKQEVPLQLGLSLDLGEAFFIPETARIDSVSINLQGLEESASVFLQARMAGTYTTQSMSWYANNDCGRFSREVGMLRAQTII